MAEPGAHVAESGGWYESQPSEAKHRGFLERVADLLLREAVFEGTRPPDESGGGCPVVRWTDPEDLMTALAEHRPSEDGRPATEGELLSLVRFVVKHSVKTGHPHFFNQLFSSLDPYGLAGQWITDALNPSVYTYEVAPVFTLMEMDVLLTMRKLVFGDTRAASAGDGIFCPGGSFANGCAINLARFKFAPEVKRSGLHGMPRMVILTSEDAHYSIHKMAALQGLGEEGVIAVRTDSEGRMDVTHLEAQIEAAIATGSAPFMVAATAGTTVLGAFDPLSDIAQVCDKYGLWLHVDAAWGGGLLFSRSHRGCLKGIERADSVTWNPHKLLAVPQQCSTLLLRHGGLLSDCHSRSASYLFQRDKFYDVKYDTGDKYLQCGRRVDVLKFWLMWKAKGSIGLERHVDKIMDNISYFTEQLHRRSGFKLVLEKPAFANVCFWFVPPRLRGLENSPDYWSQIHKVAPKLKECMMKKGSLMVNYQPLRDWPNFFRFVLQNSGTTHKDMDFVLDELELLGRYL